MRLTNEIEILRRVPLLNILDDEALRLIAFNAEKVTLGDDQTVFFNGDPAEGALLIADGSLSHMELVDGELTERNRLEAGAIVDPYALISDMRRSYTAKSSGELTYLLLDRVTFLKVMNTYPDLAERVQDYLSDDIASVASSLTGVAARLDFID